MKTFSLFPAIHLFSFWIGVHSVVNWGTCRLISYIQQRASSVRPDILRDEAWDGNHRNRFNHSQGVDTYDNCVTWPPPCQGLLFTETTFLAQTALSLTKLVWNHICWANIYSFGLSLNTTMESLISSSKGVGINCNNLRCRSEAIKMLQFADIKSLLLETRCWGW